ncbi:tetratricopeptide repeat protein [Streptomyces sp. GD-15H]|uniref:tetratricopeptide repeat protein n=1 Tax=Streptomyces sp. GD-15H TaxID=3129112 RepID=UPI0038733B0E
MRLGALPLAESLGELGEFHDAEERLGRALETFREFTDRRGEASTLRRLGDVSLARREFAAARDFWTRAAGLCEELGDALSGTLRRPVEDITDARSSARPSRCGPPPSPRRASTGTGVEEGRQERPSGRRHTALLGHLRPRTGRSAPVVGPVPLRGAFRGGHGCGSQKRFVRARTVQTRN